ncbi:ribonuclease YeeF family protein [Psychrobacillus sp. FSL K6-1415]|uniref:ribonuclease YeeF family protein n=1 Tax=Psychrobacillus sp. FSL K6-1415 TaxID=2921544 RepID=UPI0030FB1884
MKILDVDLFQEGLQRNITMLDRLGSEMEAIHQAVEGLVQMEDELKGAGGNAIRSFYQECHLPFLHFFQLFSEQFKQVLNQMEAALHSLEPDPSGYILETFLEGELEQGLTLIGELTSSLTDEANSIMDQVSDIVGLPHLDDSGVQEGVISSKRKRDDTVTQLHEFDATQTYALNPIEHGLQTMDKWLTDMEGLFQAGVKDINFLPSQWDVLTFRSDIRTELFPKVFLNPNDLWVKEQEQLIGTMITAATFQTLEGKKLKTIEENVAENIKYHAYDNGLLIKEYVVNETVFYEVVSKVEYKEEAVLVDKPKENKLLDSFQFGLDIAGLIPVVGEIADGVNGVIYAARGDALNAGLSFSAMIPVFGIASTGGKLAVKGSKAIEDAQNASEVADNVIDGAKGTEKLNDPYNGVKQASEYLQSQGVPRQFRKTTLESFDIGTIKLEVAGSNTYGLRFYDDINATAKGRYLFETFSPQVNRSNLALPPEWNRMTGIQQWQVKPDTIIIKGKAGPQYQMGDQ